MMRGAEKQIVKDIQRDSLWTLIHQGIIKHADELVEKETKPVQYRLTGRRLLDVSREAIRRVFFLSYAYRTEKDAKYLLRAQKELHAIATLPDWHPDHFLDVGEMTLAAAIGYDWLYDKLHKDERNLLQEAIIEKGLKPSLDTKKCWFIKTTNNWSQVCHGGLCYGALAVWERTPTLAAHIVNRAVENLPLSMAAYAPDGAYPEGCGYWDYGTTYNVLLLDVLRQIFGSDFGLSDMKGFMKTGEYITHMCSPALNWFSYSDNGTRAHCLVAPFWFFRETGDDTILYGQTRMLSRKGVQPLLQDRFAPAAIIWGHQTPLSSPSQPKTLAWHGEGEIPVFATRSGWGYDDSFMAMKVGSPSTNHSHMDEGAFFFESHGVIWATDLGGEDYNSLEQAGMDIWNRKQGSDRWKVFRYNNLQHNTLTFDGEEQIVEATTSFTEVDTNFPGSATADLTPVYANKVKCVTRRCSLRGMDNLYIEDHIETGKERTRLTWTMVTEANAVKGDNRTLYLNKNGHSMRLYVSGIDAPKWTIKHAAPTRSFEAQNKGVTIIQFTAQLKANSINNIRVSLKKP